VAQAFTAPVEIGAAADEYVAIEYACFTMHNRRLLALLGANMALSNSDLVELYCLGVTTKSGQVPSGCNLSGYLEAGYIKRDGAGHSLTPSGMKRLGELRESCRGADSGHD
jgi:hypothetical protein